ncbi:FMN phosphatase YigB (HAD superfamily) [Bradyrhizobium diazoefficiens]
MSLKAVVFDAYGTLYDIQSVADITEDAFPGYGEIITQVWRHQAARIHVVALSDAALPGL